MRGTPPAGRSRGPSGKREVEGSVPEPGALVRVGGSVALGVSSAAALALSARHLGLGRLPGCGLESACDRAMASEWGRLPLLDWPVAHLGSAHFVGLLGAWWFTRGGWPGALRWWTRLGAAASIGYLVLLGTLGEPCPYCLTAHLGNLAFLALSERARGLGGLRGLRSYAALALAATAGLAGLEARADSEGERALEDTASEARRASESGAFTGRHRVGPEQAAVRIVIFSDFQCPDCRAIDEEALKLVEERGDVSLSIKHFPLSTDCNPRARELGRNPHPNACWASRAAEAAGILAGTEGYWRMSHWLFERAGAFDPPALEAAAASMGFDSRALLDLVRGPRTEELVQEDIEESLGLGIATTPMVFLNGIELREWYRKDALRRTVELIARSDSAGLPEQDRPPGALEKCIEDWRRQPRLELPAAGRGSEWTQEPLFVVYGDYLDPNTRELDQRLREFLRRNPGASYSYRHFPLDPHCATGVPADHPGACRVAAALEAAYRMEGAAGVERLHTHLFGAPPDQAGLVSLAREVGFDPRRFAAELEASGPMDAVRLDVLAARRLGITTIPALLVAGRYVPRWRFGDEPVLERIAEEALSVGR